MALLLLACIGLPAVASPDTSARPGETLSLLKSALNTWWLIAGILVLIIIIQWIVYRHRMKAGTSRLREALEYIEDQNEELEKKIAQHEDAERQVKHLATHDSLTGLANRRLLNEFFSVAASRSKRNHTLLAVLYLDLDDFKPINDNLGHMAGDDVLCTVAERFKSAVRGSDIVARVGGDEFVVLLPDLEHREDAGIVAEKIIKNLTLSCKVRDHEWRIGTSIGICFYPEHGNTLDELIKHADAAMYGVKQSDKGGFAVWKKGHPPPGKQTTIL